MPEEEYQEWLEWLKDHEISMKNRAIIYRFGVLQRCCVTLVEEYGWFIPTIKSKELETTETLLIWVFLNFIKAEDQQIINHKWEEWAEQICVKAIDYVMMDEIDPKETYDVVKIRVLKIYHAYLDYCYKIYDDCKEIEEETGDEVITPLLEVV